MYKNNKKRKTNINRTAKTYTYTQKIKLDNGEALLLNGINEIKYNGNKLLVNNYNLEYTYDCVWETDKSYIAWSNKNC